MSTNISFFFLIGECKGASITLQWTLAINVINNHAPSLAGIWFAPTTKLRCFAQRWGITSTWVENAARLSLNKPRWLWAGSIQIPVAIRRPAAQGKQSFGRCSLPPMVSVCTFKSPKGRGKAVYVKLGADLPGKSLSSSSSSSSCRLQESLRSWSHRQDASMERLSCTRHFLKCCIYILLSGRSL